MRKYLGIDERFVRDLAATGLDTEQVAHGIHAQELTYLMQVCGRDLGYRFVWEIFGPFSEGVAYAIDELDVDVVRDILQEEFLQGDIESAVERLNSLKSARPLELPETLWLRLLCCVHFLVVKSRWPIAGPKAPPYLQNCFRSEQIERAFAAFQSEGLLEGSQSGS